MRMIYLNNGFFYFCLHCGKILKSDVELTNCRECASEKIEECYLVPKSELEKIQVKE